MNVASNRYESASRKNVNRTSDPYLPEVLRIARKEEQRARGINPLERIMKIRKACPGSFACKWTEDADPVRVTWTRDA